MLMALGFATLSSTISQQSRRYDVLTETALASSLKRNMSTSPCAPAIEDAHDGNTNGCSYPSITKISQAFVSVAFIAMDAKCSNWLFVRMHDEWQELCC